MEFLCQESPDHSAFAPEKLTTLPHFSVSSATNFPNSAVSSASAQRLSRFSRAFILGSARAALIFLFSLLTISAGGVLGRAETAPRGGLVARHELAHVCLPLPSQSKSEAQWCINSSTCALDLMPLAWGFSCATRSRRICHAPFKRKPHRHNNRRHCCGVVGWSDRSRRWIWAHRRPDRRNYRSVHWRLVVASIGHSSWCWNGLSDHQRYHRCHRAAHHY
jgi:hypothetical protein